jgi:hypothetical protein
MDRRQADPVNQFLGESAGPWLDRQRRSRQ